MTAATPAKIVDPLSTQTLLLELQANGSAMGCASGFVVEHDQTNLLVTNWHVLSGRDANTGQPMHSSGAIPDEVSIVHHGTTLGTWLNRKEALNGPDGKARWHEHPQGQSIDVAALPLSAIDPAVQLYPFDLSLADTDLVPQVAMPAQIIGFPLGLAGPGNFPIWKTGHIATDPDLDYKSMPAVLIDATTRGGMSGSPVVVRMNGGFATRSGNYTIAQAGPTTLFLGVYSGRIHADSEIGIVWRPKAIRDLLASI